MRIALSAMNCSNTGISESYVAYNWVQQISRFHEVKLITADPNAPSGTNVNVNLVSSDFPGLRLVSSRFRAAVKPDYFAFDWRSGRQSSNLLLNIDIFHHVVPQAPRYPSSLGRRAPKFILGPIGGGLRVPKTFRDSIESTEPAFASLRRLDAIRFRYDPWLRQTYNAADILLLTAPYMFEIVPKEFHSKVRLLPETAIDAQLYRSETSLRPERIEIRILYVGRITPYKGLEFLIRAIGSLPNKIRKKCILNIVGSSEPEYERRCRAVATDLGISQLIKFHGKVPKETVRAFYRESDIFCFPTLAETTGNVLLEAMATGLPVISTNYGGPGFVLDNDSGILVDPVDPLFFVKEIGKALQTLAVNPKLRMSLGGNAKERVLTHFSWDAKGDLINKIYLELNAKSHP